MLNWRDTLAVAVLAPFLVILFFGILIVCFMADVEDWIRGYR